MVQAGVYAGVLHYLKAVEALKSDADGKTVVAEMKELPTDDPLFGKGTHPRRRPQDPPDVPLRGEEAVGVEGARGTTTSCRATIPADEAFRPLDEGDCPLVK